MVRVQYRAGRFSPDERLGRVLIPRTALRRPAAAPRRLGAPASARGRAGPPRRAGRSCRSRRGLRRRPHRRATRSRHRRRGRCRRRSALGFADFRRPVRRDSVARIQARENATRTASGAHSSWPTTTAPAAPVNDPLPSRPPGDGRRPGPTSFSVRAASRRAAVPETR